MLVLAVTWTDWWLAGHYFQEAGDETKAAMALMGYLMWLIPTMFAAVAIGALALVARRIGAGEEKQASRVANQAFLIGGAMAFATTLILVLYGQSFIGLMELEGVAADYAWQYLSIILLVIPLIMISQVGAACLRGAGDMVTGLAAKVVVVILNILVSTMLVSGWGFLPAVGWKGLAIGTACGHAIGGFIILGVLLRGRAKLKLTRSQMRPDLSVIGKILRIGFPGGFDVALLMLSQFIFLAMINSLGNSAAAAHGLAVQVEALAFLPGAAFAAAAATMAGQFLGTRSPNRAEVSVILCATVGAAVMCAAGLLFYFFGTRFTVFFTGDPADPTTHRAAALLQIIAFAMPALAVVMIVTAGLRGAGDTAWPLFFTVVGFFVMRIPLAFWFCFEEIDLFMTGWTIKGLGMGVPGAWFAMTIDLMIRSCMIVARLLHGGWKKFEI